MKLKLVTFTVSNMENSLKFYHDILGLKIVNDIQMEHLHLVFLSNGSDVQIELVSHLNQPYNPHHSHNISLGIEYDNAIEIVNTLIANDYKASGPISPAPNTTFYFAEDKDGFVVQIIVA